MTEVLLLFVAVLVIPAVLLTSFAGCVGEDPDLRREREAKEAAEKEIIRIKEEAAKQAEAAKFYNVVTSTGTLVSFWRLEELGTGGTDAQDSVPPANNPPHNGIYMNTQGIDFGQAGALEPIKHPDEKAAEFKGTEGYIHVDYDALRNPGGSFSVEFWVRPSGNETTQQVVIGSYDLDAQGKVVRGFVLDMLRDQAHPRIRARLGNGAGVSSIEATLGDGSEHNAWRHVVMTYSQPAKSLMLYVNADDGKPDAQQPSAANPSLVEYTAIPLGSATPLRIAAGTSETIGAAGVGGAGAGALTYFFHGRLDEIALYRDALKGTEVRTHWLSGIGQPF
jgi:hypothetical protein